MVEIDIMDIFLIGCLLGALFLIFINNDNNNHGGTNIPTGWIKNGNRMYKIK